MKTLIFIYFSIFDFDSSTLLDPFLPLDFKSCILMRPSVIQTFVALSFILLINLIQFFLGSLHWLILIFVNASCILRPFLKPKLFGRKYSVNGFLLLFLISWFVVILLEKVMHSQLVPSCLYIEEKSLIDCNFGVWSESIVFPDEAVWILSSPFWVSPINFSISFISEWVRGLLLMYILFFRRKVLVVPCQWSILRFCVAYSLRRSF